ncbi:T9SS type A sorting domain-containing protein [Ascidiimonas sp. W6]|uniref:T9SS type A sorting domain-containing protein n=1 Tax=Ascidiimonas meishanensis TaxID=3128903 RepID=UPI0030EE1B38
MIRKILFTLLILSFLPISAQEIAAYAKNEKKKELLNNLPIRELDSSDIYPTLVDDFIHIKRNVNQEKIMVRIEDATGIVLFDQQLEGTRVINVSDFKAGTYLIKIHSPDEIVFGQFVKQ